MCGLYMDETQPQLVQHNCGHNPLHGKRLGTCNVSERGRKEGGGMWREVLLSTIQWSAKRRGGVSQEGGGVSQGEGESVKRRGGVSEEEGWGQ